MKSINIHTDGGARGNPGLAATGFVVAIDRKYIYKGGTSLGISTNNVAEYRAVIDALQWLASNETLIGDNPINFYLDSELVTSQLNGTYKIRKPHLKELFNRVKSLEKVLKTSVTYTFVPRKDNYLADEIVNKILDEKLDEFHMTV